MLLLYVLWYDWLTFMILGLNEQLQQELKYTLLKPDCHSWWISKMQSGREDTLEERYAIELCFKLGKNATERTKCFRLLLEHLSWIEHQFFSGIRDSRKAGSLWGRMRGVGRVRKSEHLSWVASYLISIFFKQIDKQDPNRYYFLGSKKKKTNFICIYKETHLRIT